jgi:YHS domain-containing protein
MKEMRMFVAGALLAVLAGTVGCGKGKEAAMTAVDPICKMEVKIEEGSIQAEHEGKTFYFCAEHCKETFLKDPGKYLKGGS